MDSETIVVASIFILYAFVAGVKPDWLVRWQVWSNKKVLGAKFVPSKKTYKVYRAMGILFAGMAVLVMFGVIE